MLDDFVTNTSIMNCAKSQTHHQHGRSREKAYKLRRNMGTRILDPDTTAIKMHDIFTKTQPNKKNKHHHDRPVYTAATTSVPIDCHTTTTGYKRRNNALRTSQRNTRNKNSAHIKTRQANKTAEVYVASRGSYCEDITQQRTSQDTNEIFANCTSQNKHVAFISARRNYA